MRTDPDQPFRETFVPAVFLVGDTLITFLGLAAGFWLRYASPVGRLGIEVPNARFADYLPLLLLGDALLIGAYANLGLYDGRMLLRRYQSLNIIFRGCAFWLIAYLCVSVVLKFNPPISRLFVLIAFGCVGTLLCLWRSAAALFLDRPAVRSRLQRRTALLGWNANAQALLDEIARDERHPLTVAGIISLPDELPPDQWRHLGPVSDVDNILAKEPIDLLIATRADMPRPVLHRAMQACERTYVEWKIVPAAFDIFLNGLRLQTIGRLPVLGVEDLAISRLFNRWTKRTIDLACALIGLIVSAPFIAVTALLIKRESPGGPIFFRQMRVGTGHRPFVLYKLRSMKPDAPDRDNERQSTLREDPRLLKVGTIIRRWNIDELPQFWNVLRGDMSLVGPRPERPYHVEQLADSIPHYLPRHLVKPGMTGWAQVNGLRGESSIELRIQHDIYYIENWSLWLDLQIMLLTLARWNNGH